MSLGEIPNLPFNTKKKMVFGPKKPDINTQGSMFWTKGLDILITSDLQDLYILVLFDFWGSNISFMSDILGPDISITYDVGGLNISIMFDLWESDISFYVQPFRIGYLSYVWSSRIGYQEFEFFFILHLHWRFSRFLNYKLHLYSF